MTTEVSIDARYRAARAVLEPIGQDHLLRWWGELDPARRAVLLGEIESVAWSTLGPLIDSHVRTRPRIEVPESLSPAPVYPARADARRAELYRMARREGEELLGAGKVAAFTVAGGQGTRLGFDGPKGMVPVTPVRKKTLFAWFAEMIKTASDRFGLRIPWYVMTSAANHDVTRAYFGQAGYFGLSSRDVRFFPQGMLPLFDFAGKALLAEKDQPLLGPDGHGGSLKALVRSGSLADMRERGIEILTYFQVDNPLVKPFDPTFIGLHRLTRSEMSSKVAPKAHDLEPVGTVCMADGKLTVVEYSGFPEIYARRKNADGTRTFDAGNLAIHLLDVAFIERITSGSLELPYRRAEKTVPFLSDDGSLTRPEAPSAVKLETFIFDALHLARSPLILEVDRSEEFSPVKNAAGSDSLETAVRDQIRRAARWLESAGCHVPRDPDGEPDLVIEIAPGFAMDQTDIVVRRDRVPTLRPGDRICMV